jgi:hypothetical protein
MADRLDELRKQRALVQQHLTWLDHEIAAMTVTRLTLPPFAMRSGTRPPVPTATTPAVPPGPAAGLPVPELADFQVDPDNVHVDTRRGCILYAAIALIVLIAICGVIYFVGYRDRPVLFVPEKSGPTPTMVYPTKPAPTPAKPAPAAPATPPKK